MPSNKQASFVCVGLLALLVTVGATANAAITYPSDDLGNFRYLWGGAEAGLNSKVVNGDGSVTFDVNMATNDYGKVALGIDTLKDWSTADILYLKVTLDSASGISGADAPLGIELNPFVNPSGAWVEDKDLMLLGLQDESAYHASLVEPAAANQLNWAGDSYTLAWDLTGISNMDSVTRFGFQVFTSGYWGVDEITADRRAQNAVFTVTPTLFPEPSTLAITSITSVGGGTWELTLAGNPDTAYEFRSSTILDFDPGDLVEPLTAGDPAVGTIDGTLLTTDSSGEGTVRMMLTGPANFVRAQIPPALLEDYFDAAGPGLPDGWVAVNDPVTATTVWDVGDPSDLPGLLNGNGTNCVGTNVVTGKYADELATVTLTSPPMSIPAGGATLSFRQYIDSDAPQGDVGAVRLLDATDTEIVGGDFPVTGIDGVETGWTPESYELPGTAGPDVKLVFEFVTNADGTVYKGFYIDDVVVTGN